MEGVVHRDSETGPLSFGKDGRVGVGELKPLCEISSTVGVFPLLIVDWKELLTSWETSLREWCRCG